MKRIFQSVCSVAVALACLGTASIADAQTVYRVDQAAPVAGADGLSWATAFPAIEMALANANVGDTIWVKTGVYIPRQQTVPGDPRSVTFDIPSGVDLYGGFDGTELQLSDRAGLFSQTILSGELGTPLPADNAYHVLTMVNNFFGSEIDGFVIADGNAMGAANPNGGAARTFNSNFAWFRNVTFVRNMAEQGGALYSQLTNIYTSRCTFRRNSSVDDGGAVYIRVAEHFSSNSRYHNNASRGRGGAVFIRNSASQCEMLNCVLDENLSLARGGGIFVASGFLLGDGASLPGGNLRVTNCTFNANAAVFGEGGGLWANESAMVPPTIEINNSIFWDNRDGNTMTNNDQIGGVNQVDFCDVQGGYAGTSNFSANPAFVDAMNDNFRLQAISPCRNAASNSLLIQDILDVDGDVDFLEQVPLDVYDGPRVRQGIVDVGAAETFLGDAGGQGTNQ